mgnify:CR=1 FL=1|jgi:hypothetical protein
MKKIKIGNVECNINCTAYTTLLHKKIFNKNIFKDIRNLQEYLVKQTLKLLEIKEKFPELSEDEIKKYLNNFISEDDIGEFVESATRITYILLKTANEDIEEYEEWLKTVPALKTNDEWIIEVAEFAVDCFC